MFRIKVNATSANLSVGFDVLGLALDISNEFTFEYASEFKFKGFEKKYQTVDNNLVYDSYIKVFEKLNKKPIPVEIGFKGDVPVSRGLGSSSTLIVAGVFGANKILGDVLSKDELFEICAEIEGHPDNVAPAIYGSMVASFKYEGKFIPNIYPVSKDLKFMVIIPPFKLSTAKAREVLPKSLSISDTVSNLSRIVNLPRAFETGDVAMLKKLFLDKIHEPYRGTLIEGYDRLREICKDLDCACAISGSGSTMIVISKDYSNLDKFKELGYEIRKVSVGSGIEIWEE